MKQAKLILALVLGLALYAAGTVGSASGAPAAGATAAQSLGCNPTAPARVFLGRGSTLREPDLGQVADDLPASAQGQAEANFSATVPIYFHVVTDGSIGNVTRAQINAQVDVLNNTFAGGEGGSNTGFSFELTGVTRTDNAKWFYASIGGAEKDMKKSAPPGWVQGAQPLLDHRRAVSRLGLPARHPDEAWPGLSGRRRLRLGVDPGDVDEVRGEVRPGRNGDP